MEPGRGLSKAAPYFVSRGARESRGFTLLEVLIVVLIVGVMAAATFLSLDLTDTQEARSKMRQLQIMMRTLADAAIIEGKVYGVRWRKGVATAMVYTDDRWQEFEELEETKWSPHLGLKVVLNGVLLPLKEVSPKKTPKDTLDDLDGSDDLDDQDSDEDGEEESLEELTEEEALILKLKKLKESLPQVFFLPTGLWEPVGSVVTSLTSQTNKGFSWGASGVISAGYQGDE